MIQLNRLMAVHLLSIRLPSHHEPGVQTTASSQVCHQVLSSINHWELIQRSNSAARVRMTGAAA